MQSIEHALGGVEHDIMDKVADDWMTNHPHSSSQQQAPSLSLPGASGGAAGGHERVSQPAAHSVNLHQHALRIPSSH